MHRPCHPTPEAVQFCLEPPAPALATAAVHTFLLLSAHNPYLLAITWEQYGYKSHARIQERGWKILFKRRE